MRTVAIFGGTFDPIHQGHLQSALELKQSLGLDELRLMPCHLPPHRQSPGCSSEQRLAMVKLACQDSSLQVDDRELKRQGPSYSVETLETLRQELGDGVSLSWVMGTDAFNGLESWHRWRELLPLAHVIVMARPGEELVSGGPVADLLQRCRAEHASVLKAEPAGRILPVRLSPYPIAATQIRQLLKKQLPVTGLLPAAVVDYIHQHHLYR